MVFIIGDQRHEEDAAVDSIDDLVDDKEDLEISIPEGINIDDPVRMYLKK